MQLIPLAVSKTLGNAGVFNSQIMNLNKVVLNTGDLNLQVLGDQASAANGVKILGSLDGVTFFTVAQAALVASTLLTFSIKAVFPYYQIQITNGATPQTTLVAGAALA